MSENDEFTKQTPDDVEGHKVTALDPQAGEDDVEGHKVTALDPQAGEDDVEGHKFLP